VNFSEKTWTKLLNFMQFSNTNLLYHVINIYLKVVINPDDYDDGEDFQKLSETDKIEIDPNSSFNLKKLTDCIKKVIIRSCF
jgi:hypothetical protein